jgi:replicative DNA helicase
MDGMKIARFDLDAEQAVLCAAFSQPVLVDDLSRIVSPNDFYLRQHQLIWGAVVDLNSSGQPIDVVAVVARAAEMYNTDISKQAHEAFGTVASLSTSKPMARVVAGHSSARRLQMLLHEAAGKCLDMSIDPSLIADEVVAGVQRVGYSACEPSNDLYHVDEFIEHVKSSLASRASKWLIPGMLGPQERMIVVGPEGVGKMVLLRQFAQLSAAGLHPLYEGYPIPPLRTMLVDAENPERAIVQTIGPTSAALKRADRDPGEFHILSRPAGFDLRANADRAQLEADFARVRPDLVVIGPLYKMYRRDKSETDEEAAVSVQNVFDDMRTKFDFALILEHHAPKGVTSSAREMIPFGSSAWLRWPEYGIAMLRKHEPGGEREVAIGRWRDDRIPSVWPQKIVPGSDGASVTTYMWRGDWGDGAYRGRPPWEL